KRTTGVKAETLPFLVEKLTNISVPLEGMELIILEPFHSSAESPAAGLEPGQLRVRFRQLRQIHFYFLNSTSDVLNVCLIAEQKKMRKPNRLVVSSSLRDWTTALRIVHGRLAIHHQLRAAFRCGVKEITAINRFVKPPVAGDPFSFKSRHHEV